MSSGSNIGGRVDLLSARLSHKEIRVTRANAEKFKPFWKSFSTQVSAQESPQRD